MVRKLKRGCFRMGIKHNVVHSAVVEKATKKGEQEFLDALNAALETIKSNGELRKGCGINGM